MTVKSSETHLSYVSRPAHGSRFDAEGQVINGPANENLESERDEPETRIA